MSFKIPKPKPLRPLYKGPKRYRFMLVSENTFNAVWTFRLSRMKVWILTIALFAAVVCLLSTLFVATPLGWLLPGYMKPFERRELMTNTLRIDSLIQKFQENNDYIENIEAILSGDVDTTAFAMSASVSASSVASVSDSLMKASEREREFIRQWELKERYNLSVISSQVAQGMGFHSPVARASVDTLIERGSVRRLYLTVPKNATVCAIYAGTVINVSHSDSEGGSVVLQHPNGFVSIYSGLSRVSVTTGERLRNGALIGQTSTVGDVARRFSLELWHNGTSVNPENNINF